MVNHKNTDEKRRATKTALFTALFLALMKMAVGVLTHSLAILASALDSFFDLVVSFGNFLAVKKADSDPTQNFSYGFGKLEGLVGIFQGIFISVSGLVLAGAGVWKILNGGEVLYFDLAFLVMGGSFLITFFLVRYLEQIAKKTKSLILEADAAHYRSDVFSNLAVLVGIGVVYFTQQFWIDGLLSILIAFLIIGSGYGILKKSTFLLLDREVQPRIRKKIEAVLKKFQKQKDISGYHFLRTRKSGSAIFVDVHLVFNEKILLLTAHKISDQIEETIAKIIGEGEILIHLDPVDDSE